MNYHVKKNSSDYNVVEKATNHIIGTYTRHESARSAAKQLNSGLGFDGWTPAFILQTDKNFPESQTY